MEELLFAADPLPTVSSAATETTPVQRPPGATPPALVYCPMCRKTGLPAERLTDGRVRCGSCQAAIAPSPAGPPPSSGSVPAAPAAKAPKPTKPAKKQAADEDDEERPRFYHDRKMQIAAAVTVLAMLLYQLIPSGPSYDPANPPVPQVAGDAKPVSSFYREMTKDRASASKYTEQLVKIKGKVAEVESAKKTVYLEGDSPKEKLRVLCRDEEQLAQAQKGKTVMAVGYCHGFVNGAVQIGQGYVTCAAADNDSARD